MASLEMIGQDVREVAYHVPTLMSDQVSGVSDGPAVTIGAAEFTVTKQRTDATKLEMTIDRISYGRLLK